MDEMRLAVTLVTLILLVPTAAAADNCAEEQESCVDSCSTDHGMKSDRDPLTRCLGTCEERLEDCRDVRREDRTNYGRTRGDPAPAPRQDAQAWDERADDPASGHVEQPQDDQSPPPAEERRVPPAEERRAPPPEEADPTPLPPPEPQPAPELQQQNAGDDSSDSWGEP